jgi:hypothetical protein
MVGILVHGNNHFILSRPSPDEATALALLGHWSIVQIGEAKSSSFWRWQIRPKEFRENLEWAVIVPGDRETSPGVAQLLGELSARGVPSGDCVTAAGNVMRKEQRPSIDSP